MPKTLEYADTSDNSWLISTNTYNSLGQITAHRDTHIDTTIVNDRRSYAYNTYGQLICEEFLNDNLVYTYTYDAAGNILSWEKIDTSTGVVNSASYTYEGAWADVLTKYNYTEIAYTGVGLPTYIPSVISSADAKTLTWNSDGKLSRVRLGNRLYVDMTYDASGLRTSKTYGGVLHEYTYDDGRLITEKINGYSMVFLYDESDNVDCIWYKNAKYYLIRNTFGDVVQLRDASNQVVAYYKYNAFGYLLSVTDAAGNEITDTSHIAHLNPIRYRGYYYDTELKMYYLQSRYYNPEMGRFISADALVGTSLAGTNLFAYCYNDPINYVDPTGYNAELLLNNFFGSAVQIFSEIGNALQSFAPAFAGFGSTVLVDGPLPIGDAIAVVGAVVLTTTAVVVGVREAAKADSMDTSISDEKAKEEWIPTPPDNQYNYWVAEIIDGVVTPLEPLKYRDARECVASGYNVLCRDHAAAIGIVKFYPSSKWDSRHGCENAGYLNHYHLSSAHGNHIWYFGE